MKKNVNELKEMILNQEYGFMELDGIMEDSGYYSVLNDGTTKNIKNDLNVVYTAKDTCEAEVQIFFEITVNNGEDEVEEAFDLKVIDIQEY